MPDVNGSALEGMRPPQTLPSTGCVGQSIANARLFPEVTNNQEQKRHRSMYVKKMQSC